MSMPRDSRLLPVPGTVTRRSLLRLLALSPLALALSRAASDFPWPVAARPFEPLEPTAGGWLTWLIPSGAALRPAVPPGSDAARTRAELQELLDLQAQRGDAVIAMVSFWDAQGSIPSWSQILLEKIRETGINPVRAARALALFHTAIADATIAAWDAKFTYRRPQPSLLSRQLTSMSQTDPLLPSYPSEHAAIAGAAAVVLDALFPAQTALIHNQRMTFNALANEAALSRLWAGANYRSDLEAGLRLGQEVGWQAIARGQSDGSSAVWDTTSQPGRPSGPPYWAPTPPANLFPPLEPLAGFWAPWVLQAPDQFRPPTPPALDGAFPSARFLAEANEVKQAVAQLTPDQRAIALFWADNPGQTFTPPGHWAQVTTEQVVTAAVSTPRAARALALVAAGLADSGIACWDCKYTCWVLRPITAIRTLTGQPFSDPDFQTVIPTPPFPSYISGHATFSGCSAGILEYLFPGGKVTDALANSVSFAAAADQAAASRLYAGIHYRSDNEQGLVCGRGVAGEVIRRAQRDGAP
jgi:membrane-associated phospholipid phosphatase